jgi:hypothetical protein
MTDVRTTHEVAVPSPRPRPRVPEQEDVPEDEQALISYPGVRYALAHCTALRSRVAGAAIPAPRS